MYFIVYSSDSILLGIDVPSEHTCVRIILRDKVCSVNCSAIRVVTPASIAQLAVVAISNPNSVMRNCVM